MAKKKKWKRRLKKLAKAALIGGALYGGAKLLGKRRPSVEDTLASEDANIGVTHDALKPKYITQKADTVDTQPIIESGTGGGAVHQGRPKTLYLEKQARAHLPKGSPGQINPYTPPRQHLRFQSKGGRINAKGGGIAKRGTGVALKSGGRVKSMGIAKRGGGVAKR